MNWLDLTPQQRGACLQNMRKRGGHFVNALAAACLAADPDNEVKLMSAFPEIVARYTEKVAA
jgi:hypothetical protein